MKITSAFIDKLIRLKNGDSLPVSSLRGDWVEEFLREGILINISHRSKNSIKAANPLNFESSLRRVDERLSDLGKMKIILKGETSRFEQAAETGNSKLVQVRSCPGFMINTYDSINCRLNGCDFTVSPLEGSMLFISDWEHFVIPENVVVVGIENMENFRMIRNQRQFFENEISSDQPLLFVSRYPQSSDLRRWLCSIKNQYVHFGDFDLAGINIFLSEIFQYLSSRSSFLIPSDIENRLRIGSPERYNNQYERFRNLTSENIKLQSLIDMIHKYRRCYDQEGYINNKI